MRTYMLKQLLILQLIVTTLVAGDLRVNIVNGTTNSAGTAQRVVLIDLSAGMTELSSADNVSGSTTFSDIATGGQSQYMLRATFQDVHYSEMFVPSPGVTAWETTITVYETKSETYDVAVSVPFFVIYGFEDKLYIQKRMVIENRSTPPVTFRSIPGLVNVHVPENVTDLESITFKHGTMPIRSTALPYEDGQVLPNPLKPGVSEVDLAYYLEYDPNKTIVTEKVGYDIDHFHLYTMPMDLKISLPGLSREGTDNENGLAIYAIDNVKAGTLFEIEVSGKGMAEDDGHNHENEQQQTTGRIVVENRIDQNTELLIAGVLVMALLIALFISVTQQSEDLKQESISLLKEQKSTLLKEYAGLDDSDANKEKRDMIVSRLVSVYKTLERIK